ncbi:MAG TPA: hypothetical protein VIG73_11600 [Cerasibacillus sp.]
MTSKQKQAHISQSTSKEEKQRAKRTLFTDQNRKQKEASKHTVGGF